MALAIYILGQQWYCYGLKCFTKNNNHHWLTKTKPNYICEVGFLIFICYFIYLLCHQKHSSVINRLMKTTCPSSTVAKTNVSNWNTTVLPQSVSLNCHVPHCFQDCLLRTFTFLFLFSFLLILFLPILIYWKSSSSVALFSSFDFMFFRIDTDCIPKFIRYYFLVQKMKKKTKTSIGKRPKF